MACIDIEDLTPILKYAMQVTEGLVYHIWINSLCIVQDSVPDWTAERSQMCQIHANSHYNIVRAAFEDGSKSTYPLRSQNTPAKIQLEHKYIGGQH